MTCRVGIDIGSTGAKAVALDGGGRIVARVLRPTGWSSAAAAEELAKALAAEGVDVRSAAVVATGYGRVCVPYAGRCVTEITCHARGGRYLYGADTLRIIDIGGQDTKVISVVDGAVADFVMNDKCAAGTGRFLEVMANTLALSPRALDALAASGGGVVISSLCTVFAESEVTGLIGRGESKENIAAAVVDSIAKKVAAQAAQLPCAGPTCLTGGLCDFPHLTAALARELGTELLAAPEGRYAGALGAALLAGEKRRKHHETDAAPTV